MTNIYEQHDKAFNRVSAFIIARDGERVATVAIKFPLDGASRLTEWNIPTLRAVALHSFCGEARKAAESEIEARK